MAKVKRHYHSEARTAGALETRAAIIGAARTLFASRGFAATPIEAIARKAGVAVQTVYAVFGSKRAVLLSMLDAIDDEADVGALRAVLAEGSVAEQREAIARFFGGLFTHGGDLMAAARAAGAADPEFRGLAAKGLARHRRETHRVAAAWSRAGALRPGLSARDAGDTLAAISSYSIFAELTSAGWSTGKYERWLNDAIGRLIAPAS